MLSLTLVYAAVALSALAVVRMRHEARSAQAALQEAQSTARDLSAEARQLELERAALAAPAVIEARAREQLNMRRPQLNQVVPLEAKP